MKITPVGRETSCHVSFLLKVPISSTIVSFHLGLSSGSCNPWGTNREVNAETKAQWGGDEELLETNLEMGC